MCGIFGAIATERKFEASAFERFIQLTNLVHYRGPDDSGYIAINMESGPVRSPEAFDIFLGHRRLSILDLSPAGHQPMHDGNGRWIVFNGEIFNYVELRRELQTMGHRFKTACDTEVILHIYDKYGEDGFEKLNGMWAFALVDIPRRRVVLSRDRFSIKPLYLTSVDDRICFSSETFFRGINQVPPKTNLVIDFGSREVRSKLYWDYTSAPNCRPRETPDYFRELLIDSVRIRLRSDVRVGLLLSGGLDSSTLAIIARPL